MDSILRECEYLNLTGARFNLSSFDIEVNGETKASHGMFQKERLLDILKNFILFSSVSNSRFKVLAGYHQYFAVRKAIEKAIERDDNQSSNSTVRGGCRQ